MIQFSIVICTYNRVKFLLETIDSLISVLQGSQFSYEVLIIDNNSPDDTSDLVVPYLRNPCIKYFLEVNQGLSHARNRGIVESSGDVIVFLDDDIAVDEDYFTVCEKVFFKDKVEIVGGKVLPFNTQIPNWLPAKYYYLVSIFDIGNESKLVSKVMGANYAMKASVSKDVGFYNPELGRKGESLMGGEEIEYLYRAMKIGFSILYEPKLIVYHKINNKLNKEYVFDYVAKQGLSESLIDIKENRIKYILKLLKCTIMILGYHLYGRFLKEEQRKSFYEISFLYSKGYLSKIAK